MKTLVESIFDQDLATKKPSIKGVEIDNDIWKKCEKYYKSILKDFKKITSEKDWYFVNPPYTDLKNIYVNDDCIISIYENLNYDKWICILSPETIYMNCISIIKATFNPLDLNHLENYIDRYGNKEKVQTKPLSKFGFTCKINNSSNIWGILEWINYTTRKREGIGSENIYCGYIPETISSKAKNIIKKYVK